MRVKPGQASQSEDPNRASPPALEQASGLSQTASLSILLGFMVLAVYFRALSAGFVDYDDQLYVTANPHVQAGLTPSGIAWAFQSFTLTGNWHPLTWISHMLDTQFFGVSAFGHHLTSVLLHVVNTILVFHLLLRMTGAMGRSFVAAALFGLHPMHVESVAWISERKDVLSALFGLAALLAWLRHVRAPGEQDSGSRRWYWIALVCFACSLMSKPMLVTFPFILLLLDWWPLGRLKSGFGRLIVEKLPFIGLSAPACVVAVIAQQRSNSIMSSDRLPLAARMANALVSYARYAGKMACPVDLSCLYPYPGHWPAWAVAGAAAFLAVVTVAVMMTLARRPYLGAGWFWFLGTLVPVIGVIQVGAQSIADRYTYVPSIGFFLLVVWGANDVAQRFKLSAKIPAALGAVTLCACAALTVRQIGFWNNSIALFEHATATTRDNFQAEDMLGDALANAGKPDDATIHYRRAIQINPDSVAAHSGLGGALGLMGRFPEAIEQFRVAIKLNPDHADAHKNLATTLMAQGRYDEAVAEYRAALRLVPDYADVHARLGRLLGKMGRDDEAVSHLEEAAQINPYEASYHDSLGVELCQKGRLDEALAEFQTAAKLRPDFADAEDHIGTVLAVKGLVDAAIPHFREALRLEPGNISARQNLDRALKTNPVKKP